MSNIQIHFRSLSVFGFLKGIKIAIGIFLRKIMNLFSPYELIAKSTFDLLLANGSTLSNKNGLIRITFQPVFLATPLYFNIRPGSTDIVIFNEILRHESYKPAIMLQKKLNREVKYIIDGGANIGAATVYFKSYFPDASIVSVEPADSNFSVLQSNISVNNYSNVVAFKGAIWNRNEKLAMKDFFRGEREKELSFYVEEAEQGNNAETEFVEGVTIEYLMQIHNFPVVDILKIDIEGAETKVFEKWQTYSALLSKVGILAIEIHEEVFDKWKFIQEIEQSGFKQINFGEILYVFKN